MTDLLHALTLQSPPLRPVAVVSPNPLEQLWHLVDEDGTVGGAISITTYARWVELNVVGAKAISRAYTAQDLDCVGKSNRDVLAGILDKMIEEAGLELAHG